jgi:hypothetical protein
MKAGVLTFHRAPNAGAFLQSWFLYRSLQQLGLDVVFLDPPSGALTRQRILNILHARSRGISFMACEMRGLLAYQFAHHSSLPAQRVRNNEFPDDLDVLVIGSDEVWNVRNPYFQFMYPMMWAATAKCPVITYAPSMGGLTSADSLPDEAWQAIRRYSHVSVRDRNTLAAATERLGCSPTLVCDPTLLRLAGDSTYPPPVSDPFILVYTAGTSSSRVADIRAYASLHNLKVVSAGPAQPWCDKNFVHLHPLAAHALFEQAACVYAGTFHGMILGRKFGKPLAVEFGPAKLTKSQCFLEAYCDPRSKIAAGDSVADAWADKTNPAANQAALDEWISASHGYLSGSVLGCLNHTPLGRHSHDVAS